MIQSQGMKYLFAIGHGYTLLGWGWKNVEKDNNNPWDWYIYLTWMA